MLTTRIYVEIFCKNFLAVCQFQNNLLTCKAVFLKLKLDKLPLLSAAN